jgi:hypothetical protein
VKEEAERESGRAKREMMNEKIEMMMIRSFVKPKRVESWATRRRTIRFGGRKSIEEEQRAEVSNGHNLIT